MSERARPSLRETVPDWAQIGLLSFGGPAAQIALMHRVVVEERGWLSERRYLDALAFCMLLPGPEAMQLATFAGWRMHGVAGGLVAGLLFVLPGAVVIAGLAALYLAYGDLPWVEAAFLGIKAAVLAVVMQALIRVARRALVTSMHRAAASISFVALFVFAAPFPLVIAAAAAFGFWTARGEPVAPAPHGVSTRATLRTACIWLAVWLLPLVAVAWAAPPVFGDIARFFSVLATVTFGGAYAVLAYMAQEAVTGFGWLSPDEMIDGLGLAETTPGPLILVTEFVGFLAAARTNGEWSLSLGLAGAAVTLWATFAPCFLWIFVGAPYVDWIGRHPRLSVALGFVSAAVVGVIANLSVWFALHVLFARVEPGPLGLVRPDLGALDWRAAVIAGAAAVLLLGMHRGVATTLGLSALLGLALATI